MHWPDCLDRKCPGCFEPIRYDEPKPTTSRQRRAEWRAATRRARKRQGCR